MVKLSKNYIIIIALSVISLILGGTFFAISQNNSKQNLALNSTQSSSVSQSFSSFLSQSSQITSPNQNSSFSINSEIILDNQEFKTSNINRSRISFTKEPDKLDKFGFDNNALYLDFLNTWGLRLASGDKVIISGKARLVSESGINKEYEFTEITKIEKISQNNSSQSQSSKIQPLVADAEHDVVALEECDLSVKYEKKFTPRKIENNSQGGISFSAQKASSVFSIPVTAGSIFGDFGVFCTKEGIIESKFLISPTNLKFLTQTTQKEVQNNNVMQLSTGRSSSLYSFFGKNKLFYTIGTSYNLENGFQLQFNSLAPSTPSVKL